MSYVPHNPEGSVVDLLHHDARATERDVEKATEEIERLEAEIVAWRSYREACYLRQAELRFAAGIVEKAGLKVERRGRDVHVSVERKFEEPA